ncbi:MAG: DsbA family oxidoreductase, partial [Pseudomonadota bacterium]
VDKAMAERPIVRHWRAYFLHPGLPPGGMARDELMLMKFGPGGVGKQVSSAIADAAARAGVEINYDRIEHVPNTLDAHRLMRWATGASAADDVAEGLFAAYFRDGEDIGDADVLARIGADAGMDADILRNLLDGDADRDAVTAEAAATLDMGFGGVPTQIFARRFPIIGAHGGGELVEALDRIDAKAGETKAGEVNPV